MASFLVFLYLLCSYTVIRLHLQISVNASSEQWEESDADPECSAWLVQSIPTDLPHLHIHPGILSTGTPLQSYTYIGANHYFYLVPKIGFHGLISVFSWFIHRNSIILVAQNVYTLGFLTLFGLKFSGKQPMLITWIWNNFYISSFSIALKYPFIS